MENFNIKKYLTESDWSGLLKEDDTTYALHITTVEYDNGKIEDIKIIKSSGVMMFDISVRQAIFAMKMPQWTYGKPFTINFKQ